jgi:hypothetical protein
MAQLFLAKTPQSVPAAGDDQTAARPLSPHGMASRFLAVCILGTLHVTAALVAPALVRPVAPPPLRSNVCMFSPDLPATTRTAVSDRPSLSTAPVRTVAETFNLRGVGMLGSRPPASQVPSPSRASGEACMASRRWSSSPTVCALSDAVATTRQLTLRALTALVKNILVPFLLVIVAFTPSLGARLSAASPGYPPPPRNPRGSCFAPHSPGPHTPHSCPSQCSRLPLLQPTVPAS